MRLWRRKEQGARSKKPGSRRWKLMVVILAIVVLAGGGTGAYLAFVEDENGTGDSPFEAAQDEGPPSIYYVEGNVLKQAAPDGSEASTLYEGISATAQPSPDGRFLTWVAFAGAKNPITHLYDIEAAELTTVPGTDPTWSPDSANLALVRPVGNKTTCNEEACKGSTGIVVHSPETGETHGVAPYITEWTLRGWLDGRIVGEFGIDEDVTLLVDPEAKTQAIWVDYPGGNIRSVSPDGNWVIGQTKRGPELLEVIEEPSPVLNVDPGASPDDEASSDEDESPDDDTSPDDSESPDEDEAEEEDESGSQDRKKKEDRGRKGSGKRKGKSSRLLPLADESYGFERVEYLGGPEVTFAGVDWRDDSSGFAVAYADQEETVIRVIDPEGVEQSTLEAGLEPLGDVFWSPLAGGIVFTAVNRDESQLEATYCPLEGEDCITYVTWQTGTSVVGVVPD